MPRCPKCKIRAEPIEYEGVRIYHCGGCGGHWMSQARLDVIVSRRDLTMPEAVRQKMMDLADESHTVEALTCFTCGKAMRREQFKHWDDIQLDRCPKCQGIWLDRGELEKCQIYWEFLQDNPAQWEHANAIERKALLELELQKRRDANREAREQVECIRTVGMSTPAGPLLLRALTNLFGR